MSPLETWIPWSSKSIPHCYWSSMLTVRVVFIAKAWKFGTSSGNGRRWVVGFCPMTGVEIGERTCPCFKHLMESHFTTFWGGSSPLMAWPAPKSFSQLGLSVSWINWGMEDDIHLYPLVSSDKYMEHGKWCPTLFIGHFTGTHRTSAQKHSLLKW